MRLLERQTGGEIRLTDDLLPENLPPYAILSHTWGDDSEEVSYADLVAGLKRHKAGYQKIQFCVQQAAKDGLRYSWVDTCCIDKSSSSELSEAINSMFSWYKNAAKCYVFLSDVSMNGHDSTPPEWELDFRSSRWFTRGWTLQELLAPTSVEFFSKDCEWLGNKKSLEGQINEVTGISVSALQGRLPLSEFSVGVRMSWAAKRDTKRKEDKAYSLFGIFGVSMPLVYGEGGDKAFRRLREEILKAVQEEHIEPAPKRRKTERHLSDHMVVGAIPPIFEALPKLTPSETVALDTDQRRLYLHSLRFSQIDSRHATIKAAHAKTCKWLLSKSEYRNWLDPAGVEDHNGFFWIKGKPATGKSTIMKFAYSNSKRTIKDAIIISFFFNARGEELEKTVEGMYRSLLFQLLDNAHELQYVFDILGPRGSDEDISAQWDANRVKGLFERAIENLGRRHLVCFIDALDECDEDEVREMVEFFEQLAHVAITSQTQLHVCFSSRHYPHITIKKGIQLILEGQEGHQQDIANYLHSELKAGQSKLVQQVKEEILQRASGIFLWVVLVVKMLQKEYDRGNVHALRKRLDEIPNGLFQLFQDMLLRDGQQIEELILCLQWILFAKRPLQCEELYFGILIGLGVQDAATWDPEDITEQDMERFILNSSKGLAELTKSKVRSVQFIHESVRDFLKEGKLETITGTAFLMHGHERLKQCCQTYLSVDVLKHLSLPAELPVAKSEAIADIRRRANTRLPLLEYAVRNVLYHADAAIRNGISQDTFVQDFALQDWINLNNLFEKHQIRRYTPNANLLYIAAERNLPGLILTKLKQVQYMDIRGERYMFPLCVAVVHNNEQAVSALLTPMARDFTSEVSPLDRRISPTSIICSLKDAYDAIRKNGRTPLSWAAERGHEAVVRLLLETGKVDVDSKDSTYGRTPLLWAAEGGHEAVVRLLLETGKVDVDCKNSTYGQTLLSWAAQGGHEAVVRLLLETGKVDVDSKAANGWTPLLWAAHGGHEAVVRLLLETGKVDVDSKDSTNGQTPLSWAAERGHKVIVRLLLETGKVDVDSKDTTFGRTPLLWAAESGHEVIVRLLQSYTTS